MTDKEQIIIDETECKDYDNGCCEGSCYSNSVSIVKSCDPENMRCDFYVNKLKEQLARKEQKYNLLVKTNEKHVNLLDQLNNKYINLEQEYEKLKNELGLYKAWYYAKHNDVKNILGRYHKALEEIEKLAKDFKKDICNNCGWRNTDGCSPSETVCEYAFDILDIINKAKENKKEIN